MARLTHDEFLAAVIKNFNDVVTRTKPTKKDIAVFRAQNRQHAKPGVDSVWPDFTNEEMVQCATLDWLENATIVVEGVLDAIWQEEEDKEE